VDLPDTLDLAVPGASMRAVREDDWALDWALSRVPDVPLWTYYPADLSPEDARERAARAIAVRDDGRGGRFVVERSGTAVGTVGVVLRTAGPSVYYAFLPSGRGLGLASQSLRALAGWVLEDAAPHVGARTMLGNTPSERVLERVGFRREGLDVEPDGVSVTCWQLTRAPKPTEQ
jgi:RimJ/RimL family protein N-acetyltransferase